MTARMLDEKHRIGKICAYEWFENGMAAICGKPAVAKVGMKPVCQEHLNFIRSSWPTPMEPPFAEIQNELG